MTDMRWDRWAAATGIAFVALAVVGFMFAPDIPESGAANDAVLAWFQNNSTEIGWQAFLFGLAGAAFLWFIGTLAAAIRRAENDPAGRLPAIIVVSGAAAVALYSAGMTAILGAAKMDALEAGTARVLYELGTGAFLLTNFIVVPFVLAVSLAIVRTGLLPAWLAYVGPVYAVVALVDAAGGTLSDSDAFGAGGIFGTISFLAFLAWTLVTSVLLMQRMTVEAPEVRMAPTG
jgi:hypothetical protein